MALSSRMLALLVCPEDKQSLEYIESKDVLYNPRLHRAYDIRDGIPVLLVDEGRALNEDQHAELTNLIDAGASVRTGIKD